MSAAPDRIRWAGSVVPQHRPLAASRPCPALNARLLGLSCTRGSWLAEFGVAVEEDGFGKWRASEEYFAASLEYFAFMHVMAMQGRAKAAAEEAAPEEQPEAAPEDEVVYEEEAMYEGDAAAFEDEAGLPEAEAVAEVAEEAVAAPADDAAPSNASDAEAHARAPAAGEVASAEASAADHGFVSNAEWSRTTPFVSYQDEVAAAPLPSSHVPASGALPGFECVLVRPIMARIEGGQAALASNGTAPSAAGGAPGRPKSGEAPKKGGSKPKTERPGTSAAPKRAAKTERVAPAKPGTKPAPPSAAAEAKAPPPDSGEPPTPPPPPPPPPPPQQPSAPPPPPPPPPPRPMPIRPDARPAVNSHLMPKSRA